MMNNIKALIDQIMHEAEGGFLFDETLNNPDYIRDIALNERAAMLAKLYAGQAIPVIFTQRCCVELYCEQLCNSPIKEWQAKIPTMMGTIANNGIHYVGPPDYSESWELKKSLNAYSDYSLIAKPKPYYSFADGNTIVIRNKPKGVNQIIVQGVFGDPYSCGCIDDEESIIIPADLMADLNKQIMFKLSGFLLQKKIDKRNDTAYNNQNNPTLS